MMYVDALCNGLDPLPDVPAELRARIHDEWRRYGDAAMKDTASRSRSGMVF